MEKKDDSTTTKDTDSQNGVMGWLISLFAGASDPARDRKRQLKALAKEFTKVRYKFYRPKGSVALPSLAKFFYEIYRITANASVIMTGADKSQTLKNLAIEHFFDDGQKELLDRLTEESIRERAKTIDPKTLAAQLKDDMVNFFSSLDSQLLQKINHNYTLITRFLKFISFDYYFVLKKFDSSLSERNFVSTPKFDQIDGSYIVDDIKDFQEVGLQIDRQEDWETALTILFTFKNLDVVDRGDWTKLVNLVSAVNASGILTLVVQHAGQDPYYKAVTDTSMNRIVEPYTEKIRSQVEQTIVKILNERRDAQVDKLTQVVFGTKDVQRTKNYNDRANMLFSKKASSGYLHTAPMNYSKAFLLDYFKKDVRELHELILIRGKWTTNVLSQQVSDTYYQIMAISDTILAFDESLSEEKELGAKMRKAMSRVVDKDMSSANALRQILNEINDQALKLVNEAAVLLINFGKALKMILEDYDRKDHEIIINWKELESLSEQPLKARISEVYKKFYYFIQLIQVFLKSGKPAGSAPSSSSDEDV